MLCRDCQTEVNGGSKFCPECGSPFKEIVKPKHRKKKNKKRVHRKKRKQMKIESPRSRQGTTHGYDGYYDNRQPDDEGDLISEGIDKSVLKKIALVIAGAIFVVVVSIVLMQAL